RGIAACHRSGVAVERTVPRQRLRLDLLIPDPERAINPPLIRFQRPRTLPRNGGLVLAPPPPQPNAQLGPAAAPPVHQPAHPLALPHARYADDSTVQVRALRAGLRRGRAPDQGERPLVLTGRALHQAAQGQGARLVRIGLQLPRDEQTCRVEPVRLETKSCRI